MSDNFVLEHIHRLLPNFVKLEEFLECHLGRALPVKIASLLTKCIKTYLKSLFVYS